MDERRVVLITGCSSGIGRHAAETMHARGWRVFATCRHEQDCETLRRAGLESFALDLGEGDSITGAFEEAMRRSGGRLDALFNNGAFAQPGAVEDIPVEAMRAIFEVNFFGWHDLTRRAIGVMRGQGRGRVVMCSSVLGFAAMRMRGAYNATKYALEGLTDTLRLELRGSGIHVVLIEPGPIRTRFRVNSRPHYERWIDRDASHWAGFYRETLEKRLYAENVVDDRFELACDAVSAKLVHALEAERPQPRYYVTLPTHAIGFLRRVLPTRALDALLARV